jgi:hypothetical protein
MFALALEAAPPDRRAKGSTVQSQLSRLTRAACSVRRKGSRFPIWVEDFDNCELQLAALVTIAQG